MATKKKRIHISLSDHAYEVIERHAELQGRPKSSVVSELVESVIPSLLRTVSLLEAAKGAPDEVKANLLSILEELENELTVAAHGADASLDWMRGKFEGD